MREVNRKKTFTLCCYFHISSECNAMHSMHQISSYFAPLMEAFDPFLDNLFDRSFVFSGGGTLAWTCRLYRYLYVSENKHVFIQIQPPFTNTITNSIVRNHQPGWSTCSDVFNNVRNPKHQLVFDWRNLSMRDKCIGIIFYYILYKDLR